MWGEWICTVSGPDRRPERTSCSSRSPPTPRATPFGAGVPHCDSEERASHKGPLLEESQKQRWWEMRSPHMWNGAGWSRTTVTRESVPQLVESQVTEAWRYSARGPRGPLPPDLDCAAHSRGTPREPPPDAPSSVFSQAMDVRALTP